MSVSRGRAVARTAAILVAAACAGGVPTARGAELAYDVLYEVTLVPTEGAARVVVRVGAGADALRWIRFHIDPARHVAFQAEGKLEEGEDYVLWHPPSGGGRLRYRHRIDHLRNARSYDARCATSWALFRGDDLVPPARVRAVRGAESRSRLRMRLPQGWSAVTPYPRSSNGTYRVEQPDRRFDRPSGWILAGKLGVLRERIAGVRVAVAGPVGHGVRRHDLLAMLRWTLPSLRRILPHLPERLLVVSAGDPMWRGGLSGRGSLFLHAERPLIDGDGTSPVLHELIHTVTRARSGPGGDWIVEGLAELYSLEILVRSKTVSRKRYEKTLARLEQRSRGVRRLRVGEADGDVTARAVSVLRKLDAEIRRRTEGEAGLDDVLRALDSSGVELTTELFRLVSEHVAGDDLGSFFERYVPAR